MQLQFQMLFASFLLLSQSQRSSNISLDLILKLCSSFPPHARCVNIRGRLVIGLSQHAHDADQNLFDALDGAPALRGVFVVVWVVAGWVEDGDADDAVWVYCELC